jgi:uncharacterized MAPEG superfamily protein
MALTWADLSLLGAVAAYMLPISIAKYSALKQYDNARPRDPEFYREPSRARALSAHQNGMEGFAFFVAAVIVAQLRGAAQPVADGLALAYVALRLAYVAAYLSNRPTLRSTIWSLGFVVNAALFLAPLYAR